MKKLLLILILSLFLIASVSALKIDSVKCDDKGVLEISIKNNEVDTYYTKEFKLFASRLGKEKFIVDGDWESTRLEPNKYVGFKSNPEGQLRHLSTYYIDMYYEDNKKESFQINCPGVKQTCEFLDVDIKECYVENGYFKAYLKLGHVYPSERQDALKLNPVESFIYNFNSEKEYKDINGKISKIAELFENSKFIHLDDEDNYLLQAYVGDNVVIGMNMEYKFFLNCIPEGKQEEIYDSWSNWKIKEKSMGYYDTDKIKDSALCYIKSKIANKSTEEITEQGIEETQELSKQIKDYVPYYIIGGCILLGLIIIAIVLMKKKV